MLTQCPSCRTTFRVTGAILRAAHGQVRCGQCNTQFDAIEHLIENESAAVAAPPQELAKDSASQTLDSATANIEVEEPLAEEITLEGRRIEISGVYRTLAEGAEEPQTETIVQEFVADHFVESEEASAADTRAEAELRDYLERNLGEEPPSEPVDAVAEHPLQEDSPAASSNEPPRNELAEQEFRDAGLDDLAPQPTPPRGLGWSMLCAVLLLMLVAQVVHHFRQDLARRADIGPQVTNLYAILGVPLEPRWELGAYSLKQWGVVSDPNIGGAADTLRVRASIANNASFAQPYPLLKLTLEDRFGAEVGTREFTPEEYLASASQAKRLLKAGESANADVAIVDPGEEAVGFQLKMCLKRADGLECTG